MALYIILLINLIGNILLTAILIITSGNIKLLNRYQKAYLIISIILWIIICIYYILKLLALIYIQIRKKFFRKHRLEQKIKLVWGIINGISYILMLIGFIYDIILLLKGQIASVAYLIIYFIICFIYFIFSIIDFFFIESIVNLVCKIPLREGALNKERMDKETDILNDDNKKKTE